MKLAAAALAAIATLAVAGPLAAQPMTGGRNLDARERNIERHLHRAERNGVLTPDQARRCLIVLRRIHSEEMNMRQQNGGALTEEQFEGLNARLDQLNNWSRGAALSDLPPG
jgi:hypothetical protein